MTLGEYRVGISFNPGHNHMVDMIKRQAADLIDLIDSIKQAHTADPCEVDRLKNLAKTSIEDGAMWAVKAATKGPREG